MYQPSYNTTINTITVTQIKIPDTIVDIILKILVIILCPLWVPFFWICDDTV